MSGTPVAYHAARLQVVKGYPQGMMSKHIVSLEPGDQLEFKGPIEKAGLLHSV